MREEIEELLNRTPFVPFEIALTSGERTRIDYPHLVALGESVIHVMVPKSDRYAILRMNQIAAIRVLEASH